MKSLMSKMNDFLKEEDGVTAIEYGLIASLIAVAIIVAITATGEKLSEMFTFITSKLKTS